MRNSQVTKLFALMAIVWSAVACGPNSSGSSEVSAPASGSPAAMDAAAGTTVEWPVTRCGTYSGEGCAPTSDRVDVERPKFSNPTQITNPLFPISALDSVVLLGEVDGLPFRSETTLIPGTQIVTVDGEPIEVVVSQYTAFLDGRIEEVAIDRYAQADDGSVWYLGEDVFDYRDGAVAITEGTWLAGRDGPPAMIMPAAPQAGDVFRAENVIGVVFEEIVVKAIDQTVDGPRGPVSGVVIMQELHLDGSVSDKIFAPGYGEFDSSHGADVEALALALPNDAIDEVVPAELRLLSTSAWGILENARLEDWEAANPTLSRMQNLWQELVAKNYPPRVVDAMNRALEALMSAVTEASVDASSQAAVDVAQSALDLELLYRGNVEVDRFHLHAQQLRVHAAANDLAGVTGEVAVLEWIRDRLASSLNATRLADLDAELRTLRGASNAGNVAAAADHAARAAAQLRSP
ncbi:MAG: hypothetical protein H0T94_10490 [Acidimicrobiia bacterium]|nr:hypothetical protein [Acidimicrobiia bacterium]